VSDEDGYAAEDRERGDDAMATRDHGDLFLRDEWGETTLVGRTFAPQRPMIHGKRAHRTPFDE
jgi:hypothetical protein